MRITAFIGAAAIGLAMMAFAPVAMAVSDLLPDKICVLDLSQSSDVAFDAMALVSDECSVAVADARFDPTSLGGDQGEAAPALCATVQQKALDPASYRLHVDPGRCSV